MTYEPSKFHVALLDASQYRYITNSSTKLIWYTEKRFLPKKEKKNNKICFFFRHVDIRTHLNTFFLQPELSNQIEKLNWIRKLYSDS